MINIEKYKEYSHYNCKMNLSNSVYRSNRNNSSTIKLKVILNYAKI